MLKIHRRSFAVHRHSRLDSGVAMPLIIGFFILICLVAFVLLNYSSLFGSHKQAQSAIDAAALQAAKDLSSVVVTTSDGAYFGTVGVVDDSPKNGNLDNGPVLGINTIMATIRLDALIANQLGNSTMVMLAAQDLRRAEHDAKLLKDTLLRAANGEPVKDKNGKAINLLASAQTAYDENPVRSLKGAKRKGSLSIKLGTTTSTNAASGAPVPTPLNLAQVNPSTSTIVNGITVYKANTPIQTNIMGKQLVFRFTPVSSGIALVDNSLYSALSSNEIMPPTLVQVVAEEEVGIQATGSSDSQNKADKKVLQVVATAQCGTTYSPKAFPSGTLQVSFPGATAPPSGQGVDFSSVKAIMNNSQITLDDSKFNSPNANLSGNFGTTSPYTGWNQQSSGNWFTAVGGAVPANPAATLSKSDFRGRSSDDPSVVLAFTVYDWLRHMYLRPDIQDATAVLSAPLWNGSQQAVSHDPFGMSPAYADVEATHPITFGLFKVPMDGEGDPRDLRNFAKAPDGYRRQFANVFGYVAADMTLPATTMVVSMDDNGRTITTNGKPVDVLFDFYRAITKTNKIAGETFITAKDIVKEKSAEAIALTDKIKALPEGEEKAQLREKRKAVLIQLSRAVIVAQNAEYAADLSLAMLNDRKILTSFGVERENNLKFQIITGYFYPVAKPATREEILATGPISTGQDASLTIKDWSAADEKKENSFTLVSSIGTVKTSSRPGDTGINIVAPAFAATTVPPGHNNIFAFHINQQGKIVRALPMVSLSGANLLEGQFLYQNTASWITTAPGSPVSQVWNCIARDNGATNSGGYFASTSGDGSNIIPSASGYPPLVAEWSLRCPAPTTPYTPTPPTTTPPTTNPPNNDVVTTPPTEQQPPNPQFCQSNGSATMIHVDGQKAEKSLSIRVDQAGNITYLWGGSVMKFYNDYDAWDSMAIDKRQEFDKAKDRPEPIFTTDQLGSGEYNVDKSVAFSDSDLYSYLRNLQASVDRAKIFYADVNGCSQLFYWSS